MNITKLFKIFISATTPLTILPLYYIVLSIDKPLLNYKFESYAFVAPLWLGSLNVLWYLLCHQLFGIRDNKTRFLLLVLLSFMFSVLGAKLFKAYNFDKRLWYIYYITLFMIHFIMWFIIVQCIENLIV